jgi:hypothetical protein
VFTAVSAPRGEGSPHPGLLTLKTGGGVSFRQVAWVRSSLLAGVVTSQDKTMMVTRRRNPWPFPS